MWTLSPTLTSKPNLILIWTLIYSTVSLTTVFKLSITCLTSPMWFIALLPFPSWNGLYNPHKNSTHLLPRGQKTYWHIFGRNVYYKDQSFPIISAHLMLRIYFSHTYTPKKLLSSSTLLYVCRWVLCLIYTVQLNYSLISCK